MKRHAAIGCILLLVLASPGTVHSSEPATPDDLRRAAALLPGIEAFEPRCGVGAHLPFVPYTEAVEQLRRKPGARAVAETLSHDDDGAVRYLCIHLLTPEDASPEQAGVLLEFLADPDRRVGHLVYGQIRDLTPPGGEEAVLKRLRSLAEGQPCPPRAAQAIAAYRSPEAAHALAECLDLPVFTHGKVSVFRAMGYSRRPELVPLLIPYLDDVQYTNDLLLVLRQLGNPTAVPKIRAFVERMTDDTLQSPPESVRHQWTNEAIHTLWALHRKADTFDFIARTLEDLNQTRNPLSQRSYLRDYFYPAELPPYILEAYSGEYGMRKRLAEYYLIDTFGTAPYGELPLARWQERYRRVGPRVLPLLLDCCDDPEVGIHRGALDALQWRVERMSEEEQRTVRAKLEQLATEGKSLVPPLADCLYRYPGDNTLELLKQLSRCPDEMTAVQATAWLVQVDKAAGLRRYRHFLRSQTPWVAQTAASALLVRGDDSGVPLLLKVAREQENVAYAINIGRILADFLGEEPPEAKIRADRVKELDRLEALWQQRHAPSSDE